MGKGVSKAVENVNKIIGPAIIGIDPRKQKEIDTLMSEKLDNTPNKAKLGANAILGVSLAVCRAGAAAHGKALYQHIADLAGNKELVLPVPFFNVINGGSHAGNQLAYQEFMFAPVGATSFREAMQIGCEVYQTLKKNIKAKYGQNAANVGDEGGFCPDVTNPSEALNFVKATVQECGYQNKVIYGMDCAASEFFKDGKYNPNKWVPGDNGQKLLTRDQLLKEYENLQQETPELRSIEDGFAEDDWEAWKKQTTKMGKATQIVGDDLLVTNVKRIQTAISQGSCNALLLKVNQIGTLTEAIDAVKLVKSKGWGVMTSHRSGETEDPFIADLAVGLATGQIKTGAPCRSERMAKYNQLLRIEEELGGKAKYAGLNWRKASNY